MEISMIIYAVTLAENLNFSLAAERLFIAQPTLSQQIRKLESELGFPIFLRNTKSVKLTPAGDIFIKEARNLVFAYQRLKYACDEINHTLKDSVSLGMSIITLPLITADIIFFMDQFPNIKLNIVECWDEEAKQLVASGALDAAIVLFADYEDQSDFSITPLSKSYMCISVSPNHHLAKKESVALKDFADERMIFACERSGLKHQLMREFNKTGFDPQKWQFISATEARVPLVLKKNAITFTMHNNVEWSVGTQIVNIPIEPRMYRTCTLCVNSKKTPLLPTKHLIEVFTQRYLYSGNTVQ